MQLQCSRGCKAARIVERQRLTDMLHIMQITQRETCFISRSDLLQRLQRGEDPPSQTKAIKHLYIYACLYITPKIFRLNLHACYLHVVHDGLE